MDIDPSPAAPARGQKTFKNCVRHFTPAWFAVIMGTGVISSLFHSFPYGTNSPPLRAFVFIFFFLNLALFLIFNVLTISRYFLFPDIWSVTIRLPTQSLYIGCYPMGGATLISVATTFLYGEYGFGGKKFLYALWGLWWLDVVLSFLCAFMLVHVMKTKQDHSLSRMTPAWLLNIVTLIVASSTGGLLSAALLEYSQNAALITLVLSACMVSVGLALALMMLTMYLLRLIVFGLPPGGAIMSVLIPLGATGQAGYSILLLASGFRSILPLHYGNSEILLDELTGRTINVICTCIAFALWSIATMWLLYAVLAISEVIPRTRLPFKVPFWGLIFPNGIYAALTIQLGHTFDCEFFRMWGAIYSAITLILWVVVSVWTLVFIWSGAIFEDNDGMAGAMEKRGRSGCRDESDGRCPADPC